LDAVAIKPAPVIVATSPAPRGDLAGIVHLLTCGSVDDGKSTLIGRLLWDAADLPEDTRANLLRSAGPDGEPDLSLLVDGLAAEREQGITIDIAWRYFDTDTRRFVIIDSPGHEQYTRNMASGASHADVAIMLVDARHGVKRQTRRHAAILDLVGVKRVILAVNKMDLVGWSEQRFREIEADFSAVAAQLGFVDAIAVPVAARPGDNVARKSAHMPWYSGPTLLSRLLKVPGHSGFTGSVFRFPVQTVLRDGDFRGLAGTVTSGMVAVGDVVRDSASGREATVRRITTMDGDLPSARAGQAVAIQLDSDLDIARGAVLSLPSTLPISARRLDTHLVWLSDAPFNPNHGLLVRTATDLVPVAAIELTARLDLETLTRHPADGCTTNDIVLATLTLGRPAAVDRFADCPANGSFILVDALTGATVAGGVVKDASAGTDAEIAGAFRLTKDMLARGVCTGLDPASAEFRRRAGEVAIILGAAGIAVELE
jgi:bifunctional enzyme CysN/CysC